MLTRWYRQWKANRAWRKLGSIAQLIVALETDPALRKALRKALRVKGTSE